MSQEESDDDDDGRVMGGQGAGRHSNCEQYFKLNLIISASSPLAGRNSWGMLRSELFSLSRHFWFYIVTSRPSASFDFIMELCLKYDQALLDEEKSYVAICHDCEDDTASKVM